MTSSPWTKDRVRRLARHWRDGRSAAWIARDLGGGASRCSVLGKVYRLGLKRPPSTPSVVSAPARHRVSPARTAMPVHPSTAVRRIDRSGLPPVPTATILTVGAGQCRWPYGQPDHAAFGLCGRSIGRGAFCLDHAAVGYQRRTFRVESLLDEGVPD
ncbi:GcrA family cell cycle regulator [Brevundimonas sp.]|uniref:GcrA family cell cycle regulator n=1 Tax=Brevundimonas sp. TaxID=1871086 RepID=UPI0037BF6867